MAARSEDHERTMAFAEIALGQIKALGLPAFPRNYEILYTYATGYHPQLNQAINDSLHRSGTISTAELDQLYDTYFSPARLTESIAGVGAKVVAQIDEVLAMIRSTLGSAGSSNENLAAAILQLGKAKDRESLHKVVESLVTAAKQMESTSQVLESRLNASKRQVSQLQQELEVLRRENLSDPLTSLANRQYFDQALQRTTTEANRTAKPLSLLLADIDHFKKFNDTFGHATGDQVLRLVAASVRQNIKGADLAARYGGEEFAVILPNTASRQAKIVAEHIRRSVMANELMKRSTGEHLGRITVSIGVATYRQGEPDRTLIERTDASLLIAKGNGRNRVICEAESTLNSLSDSHGV